MSFNIYDCRVVLNNNELKVYKDDKEVLTANSFTTIHIWLYNVEDMSVHFATASDIEIPYCSRFEIVSMNVGVANVDIKKLAERGWEIIKKRNFEDDYFYTGEECGD